MALGRWQLPLLRRRLLLRWVARNGVGFACSRLATGWHYGVDVNSDPSRARGPGRRRPPRLRRRFVFSVVAGEARDGARALAPLLRRRLLLRWVARNGVGFACSRLATGWHYAALTLIATPRAREGRGGADRRAYVADLFFLLSLVRRGMALGRWQPLLRRRLLLRWVARNGVGFECSRLATGWHYRR